MLLDAFRAENPGTIGIQKEFFTHKQTGQNKQMMKWAFGSMGTGDQPKTHCHDVPRRPGSDLVKRMY